MNGIRFMALGLLVVVTAGSHAATNNRAEKRSKEAVALHALFDEEWEHSMRVNPTWASRLGDRRWNNQWEDASPAAAQKEHERDKRVLAQLKKIDRAKLTPVDQLNYDLFQKRYALDVEGFPYKWHLVALNQRDGIQTSDELADALRFQTAKDYEDWIARLQKFGAYTDQTIALLREGIKERVVLPKVTMKRVPGQIEKQLVRHFWKRFQ